MAWSGGSLPLPKRLLVGMGIQPLSATAVFMAYEIAKLILEHARSRTARKAAVRAALGLGMPLREVEDYLDWLDMTHQSGQLANRPDENATDSSPQDQFKPNNDDELAGEESR